MVGEEEYLEDLKEDLEDEDYANQLERQKAVQDEVYDDTAPSYEKKDDLYSLFWRVVRTRDSSKVGNVDKAELGMLNITIRDCQKIALLADTLGHPGFGDFFREQAEIILATSASRKGWLPELFVSQKKFATKGRDSNLPQLQPQKKKGLFGNK